MRGRIPYQIRRFKYKYWDWCEHNEYTIEFVKTFFKYALRMVALLLSIAFLACILPEFFYVRNVEEHLDEDTFWGSFGKIAFKFLIFAWNVGWAAVIAANLIHNFGLKG